MKRGSGGIRYNEATSRAIHQQARQSHEYSRAVITIFVSGSPPYNLDLRRLRPIDRLIERMSVRMSDRVDDVAPLSNDVHERMIYPAVKRVTHN